MRELTTLVESLMWMIRRSTQHCLLTWMLSGGHIVWIVLPLTTIIRFLDFSVVFGTQVLKQWMHSMYLGKGRCVGGCHLCIWWLSHKTCPSLLSCGYTGYTSLEVGPVLAISVPRWSPFCQFCAPLGAGSVLSAVIHGRT